MIRYITSTHEADFDAGEEDEALRALTKPDVEVAGAAELLLGLEDDDDEATTGTTVDVVAGAET